MLQSMSSTQPYTAGLRDQTQHYHSKCKWHQHGVGYEPDYWPDNWVGAYAMFCELMIYFLQAVNLRKTSIPPSSAYNLGRGQCLAQYE